jgi:1-acyl-sn-glycerol-3-phosphate acyltransferase
MFKAYRLAGVSFLFCVFIVGALVMRLYAVTDVNRRRVSVWWTSVMCGVGCKFLGIRTHADNTQVSGKDGRLMVCNHMSYLDILVISSVRPSVFISSVEMEKTFFLGFLAKIGGTFFVERRNVRNIKGELDGITQIISQGFNVVLFPEGTSTDGSKILPFRSSFLAGASEAGVEVVPVCLKYSKINGEAFSPDNCDTVCWYGDMSFAPHFSNFVGIRRTDVELSFMKGMNSLEHDRKYITRRAQELIETVYFTAS